MEKEQLKFYESPEVQVIQIENDNILCASGEEWDEYTGPGWTPRG